MNVEPRETLRRSDLKSLSKSGAHCGIRRSKHKASVTARRLSSQKLIVRSHVSAHAVPYYIIRRARLAMIQIVPPAMTIRIRLENSMSWRSSTFCLGGLM